MPKRIQLRRTRGWRKPDGVVRVTRPGPFGNPYAINTNLLDFDDETLPPWAKRFPRTNDEAVEFHRRWIMDTESGVTVLQRARRELRGKDLACWCPLDAACHADTLLELVND